MPTNNILPIENWATHEKLTLLRNAGLITTTMHYALS